MKGTVSTKAAMERNKWELLEGHLKTPKSNCGIKKGPAWSHDQKALLMLQDHVKTNQDTQNLPFHCQKR